MTLDLDSASSANGALEKPALASSTKRSSTACAT